MACSLAGAGRGLAVLSDVRTGLPGGADEANGGDAAAALLFGEGPGVIAETIGGGTATGEFLDRWRAPGDAHSRQWEERFGEHAYVPLAEEAVADALKSAGLTADDLDHVIVTGLHSRAVASVRRGLGARPEALVDDLTAIDRQPRRRPRRRCSWPTCSTGPSRARRSPSSSWPTAATSGCCARPTPSPAYAAGASPCASSSRRTRDDLTYAAFLTWRGFLRREPPRRPEPDRPAAPPQPAARPPGSTASSAAGTRAASSTCRRPG